MKWFSKPETSPTTRQQKFRLPFSFQLGLLLVLLIAVALMALCLGAYDISPEETLRILLSPLVPTEPTWTSMQVTVVWEVRMPRILAAMLVGASLAVAGAAYQGTFRNPLVSPDLLGVSSGACIGAAVAILCAWGFAGIQAGAFVGGILAVALTVTIPRLLKRTSTVTLVLSGIIVGGFCGSILGIIKYVADPETQLPDIVYWQMGSLAKASYDRLAFAAPVMLVALVVLLAFRWRINLLSLGDAEARALGVNLRLERGVVVVCATLLTASAVCLAGTVGWVGLVLPHLARMAVGPDTARSLPIAVLMGASFMVVVDTLARITGAEIPLGIITGLVGTPFFVLLLARQREG